MNTRARLEAEHANLADDSSGARAASTGSPKPKVFTSYARRRSADWLKAALKAKGFEAYIDRRDITPGESWRKRLRQLIRSADAVVFVVTPGSVASAICQWEAEEAALQANCRASCVRGVSENSKASVLQTFPFASSAPRRVKRKVVQDRILCARDGLA